MRTGRARIFGLLDRSGFWKGDGMSRGSWRGNVWAEVMSRSRGMLGRTMLSILRRDGLSVVSGGLVVTSLLAVVER